MITRGAKMKVCYIKIEPTKVDMRSRSHLKVAMAERMFTCIPTNEKT